LVADHGGVIWALDAASGVLRWEWQSLSGSTIVASPLLVGPVLVTADTGGAVYFHDSATGELRRQLDLGAALTASPTWTGEAVVLATQEGELLAISDDPRQPSADWKIAWETPIAFSSPDPNNLSIFASPVLVGDRLYVLPRSGELWELEAAGGAARLVFDLGETALATPALYDGILYLCDENGLLTAFDIQTETMLWQSRVSGLVRFQAAVDSERVYVPTVTESGMSGLSALDRATGDRLWESTISGGYAAPQLFQDLVIVAGQSIAALDRETGEERWRTEPFPVVGTLAVSGGAVYAGAGPNGASFMAVDAATGAVLWSRSDIAAYVFGRPAVDSASGTVIAGARDGRLWAFDAASGDLRWQLQTDGSLNSDVVVSDGVAYTTAQTGTLYAVEVASGRLVRSFRPGDPLDTFSAPVISGATLYAVRGSTLYRLQTEP
jgi:outer membrane protein assembly factor BamB